MKIALKTFIALIITAFLPMALFFLIGALFGVADIFSKVVSGTLLANLDDMLINVLGWVLIDLFVVAPISFGHVFLLGLPLFLVGWQFRVIRWWSTLFISFILGAVPSVLLWLSYLTLRSEQGRYFLLMQNVDFSSLAVAVSLAVIMGCFGLTAGLAFWFLWRFWVSPDSPHGRPLSALPAVEVKPLSENG
jgi:hypothetical protein